MIAAFFFFFVNIVFTKGFKDNDKQNIKNGFFFFFLNKIRYRQNTTYVYVANTIVKKKKITKTADFSMA